MTQIFNKKSQAVKRKLLRRNAPSPERILWQALRNRKINGQKFKRQFSIGRYIEENIDNVIDKINSFSLSLRRRGLASSEG